MTNSEAIVDLQFLARRFEDLDQLTYSINRESLDLSVLALEENTKLKAEIEQLKSELEQSVKFPCKVGDKLFSIENGYIEEFKARSLSHIVNLVEFSRFDETVFFTREEAEHSLKGQVEE